MRRIMKKTYIMPEMEIIKVQTHQMLAASVTTFGLDGLDLASEVLNDGMADAPSFVLDNTDLSY